MLRSQGGESGSQTVMAQLLPSVAIRSCLCIEKLNAIMWSLLVMTRDNSRTEP